MKARKFWKGYLTVRWLLITLLAIVLAVVLIVFQTVKIKAQRIDVLQQNMEFARDGFTDFYGKKKEDCEINKKVCENDKYVMFIDENTTIVSVCEKESLIPGEKGNKVGDYNISYSSAKIPKEGEPGADTANFELEYISTDLAKSFITTMNSTKNSVYFKNELTKENEKHYAIKYLNDAVQIYYTIGNFANVNEFFTAKYYATVYEPARAAFQIQDEWDKEEPDELSWKKANADWEKAKKNYRNDYLEKVGKLETTFEERFRGNVKIDAKRTKLTGGTDGEDSYCSVTYPRQTIEIYTQEGRDYLFFTVLPEIWEEHDFDPDYMPKDTAYYLSYLEDYADLDDTRRSECLDRILHGEKTDSAKTEDKDAFGNVYWRIKVPLDLLRYDSEYYKRYFNNDDSPLTNNPFLLSIDYDSIKGNYLSAQAIGDVRYPYYRANFSAIPTSLYNYLYKEDDPYYRVTGEEPVPVYYETMKGKRVPFTSSGFPQRDEDGSFVHDEDGNVIRQMYNNDIVKEDNAKHDIKTPGQPYFKVALEFKLNEDGLLITLPHDGLLDSSNVEKDDPEYDKLSCPYLMTRIKICHNMTSVDADQEGYVIVPDGSGAIINFNNGQDDVASANFYGPDNAYPSKKEGEKKAQLLLGMFAFVNTTPGKEGGILAAVEKGAGQVLLTAASTNVNLWATIRSTENVPTGTPADTKEYLKWDEKLAPSDIIYNYMFLGKEETDYSVIAKKYQKYLIDRYDLKMKDKTDLAVNDIDFIGTFEKYASFLGIKYMTSDTLTTFKEAKEIIDELYANDVKQLSVSYHGWTNECLEYETGGKLKVSRKLGNKKAMRGFYEYCCDKNIPFYPKLQIAGTNGWDYMMGSMRYTARGAGNDEAIRYSYNLASKRIDKKQRTKRYYISPLYYEEITEKLMRDYKKLKIWNGKEELGGFFLSDIGNQWNGNYRKKRQVYGWDSVLYQQDVMNKISASGRIKIPTPCDYAFPYLDEATNVPVKSKEYKVYNYTIPFYQLVVSGLFDYTTNLWNGPDELNETLSMTYDECFLKALETGSNFSFMLVYQDPEILLKTDYTEFYKTWYKNIMNVIIEKNKEINDLGIHECYLMKHEILVKGKNLYKVTYENKHDSNIKIVLIINDDKENIVYNGITYESKKYYKEGSDL